VEGEKSKEKESLSATDFYGNFLLGNEMDAKAHFRRWVQGLLDDIIANNSLLVKEPKEGQ
jgi:hypothetical protein